MAKFGGPTRSGGSSLASFGSGRLYPNCDFGKLSFNGEPIPDGLAPDFGFPPLIEMPTELFPLPLPAPAASLPPVPEPAAAFGVAPAAPGFPSGDIATRAARFPCGEGTTGAGGAGFADSAISEEVALELGVPPMGTSGTAALLSPFSECAETRGAEDGLISSFGLAGPFVAEAMFRAATCCSTFGRSGVGSPVAVALDFAVFGCRFAKAFSSISIRGLAGACEAASCTTLGICGKILGASAGAAVLIKV